MHFFLAFLDQEVIQQGSGGHKQDFFSIGATIRIGRETLCLLFVAFFYEQGIYVKVNVKKDVYIIYEKTFMYATAAISNLHIYETTTSHAYVSGKFS